MTTKSEKWFVSNNCGTVALNIELSEMSCMQILPQKSQAFKGSLFSPPHASWQELIPLLSLMHGMQSAVHQVYQEKTGFFRTISMKNISFAVVRQFHSDGRDINNISVSIASCYGSNEVEKKSSSTLSGLENPMELRLCFKNLKYLYISRSLSIYIRSSLTARRIFYLSN